MISPRSRIVLDNEVQSVLVGFRDEDVQPLFFTWIVNGQPAPPSDISGFTDPQDETLHYSTLRARRALLDDGDEVQVIVTDGEDAVRVTWLVEKP